MYREADVKKYAELIVKTGVNVQKNQIAVVRTPVECYEFANLITEKAFLAGAKDVITIYSDSASQRLRFKHATTETLCDVPSWSVDRLMKYANEGACFISITGDDPDAFEGLDQLKIGESKKAVMKANSPYYDKIDKGENQWTVVAYPGKKWSSKVFPELSAEEAQNKLWDSILSAVRISGNEDPVKEWAEHSAALASHCRFLGESGIVSMKIKNSLGTDIEIGLAEDYIWAGGSEKTVDGVEFQANMPTEEVFTMPHREKVNGIVYASLPLSYQGVMVEDFYFRFENGKVVDYGAKKGKEALTQLLATDEGSSYLGELALVAYETPIRQTGILFYNTLFDENAACHLALGSAYAMTMKGGPDMTKDERTAKGCNDSVSHVDFMFGTADLSITGITADGTEIPVFENGGWVKA
ncbi:MAG: aminopeptidase [Eubacteriales bacterium]|nr:aminopeptidase [Eubacteriales bacterium]MDD4475067.1 aminopeptidase [Eubacteriales bacterium]